MSLGSSSLPNISSPRTPRNTSNPLSREESSTGAKSARSTRRAIITSPTYNSQSTVHVKSKVDTQWESEKRNKKFAPSEEDKISKIMLHSMRHRRGSLYEKMDVFHGKMESMSNQHVTGNSRRSRTDPKSKPTFKTFDKFTGTVEERQITQVPNRDKMVQKLYRSFWADPAKVDEAEQLAGRLPMKQQKELAIKSLHRKHVTSLKVMRAREILPDDISVKRAAVSYDMDVHEMIDHLDGDTKELSLIRILRAATDTLLYSEAEKLADVELGRFVSKVLPDHISRVQLLEMRLDSYRHKHVPAPPREMVPQTPPHQGGGRLQRRQSFKHKGGIQAMLGHRETIQTEMPSSSKKAPSISSLFARDGEFSGHPTPNPLTPIGEPLEIG